MNLVVKKNMQVAAFFLCLTIIFLPLSSAGTIKNSTATVKPANTVVTPKSWHKIKVNKNTGQFPEHKHGELLVKFAEHAITGRKKAFHHNALHLLEKNTTAKFKGKKRLKVHRLHHGKPNGKKSSLNNWRLLEVPDDMTTLEAAKLLAADPAIEIIEANGIIHANAIPDDSLFSNLWGMPKISAPQAWETETGYSPIIVGVIDTGVDYTHEDLAANMWQNPGEIPGNGVDDDLNGFVDDVYGYDFVGNDGDPMDEHGHGTHVSGTIGAVGNNGLGVVGVNWNIQIMAIRFLNASGRGTLSGAAQAIDYATQMGARLTNNSWGGVGSSQILEDAINRANNADVLFVAAAGNAGADIDFSDIFSRSFIPAGINLPNIISVAATDEGDNLASFSNYGAVNVDLAAPGVRILSTISPAFCDKFSGLACNALGYIGLSGTSMASPHVAGAAALLLSANPLMSAAEVKAKILASTDPLPQLAGTTVSGGRLNLEKLLASNASPNDFKVTATPQNIQFSSGDNLSALVSVDAGENYSGTVLLQAVSTNPLIIATLSTNEFSLLNAGSENVTLNISTDINLARGRYAVNITATDLAGVSHSRLITLISTGGPYVQISSPVQQNIEVGGTVVYEVTLTSMDGLNDTLSLAAESATLVDFQFSPQLNLFPAGMTVDISPSTVTLIDGGSATVTVTVNVPSIDVYGQYDIMLNVTGEKGTLNRTSLDLGVWAPGTDLILTNTLLPANAVINIGNSFTYSTEVRNIGINATLLNYPFYTGFKISTDNNIAVNGTKFGYYFWVKNLSGSGGIYSANGVTRIPQSIAPGKYFVGMYTDTYNRILESNELNNYSNVVEIEVVNGVDFVVSDFSISNTMPVSANQYLTGSTTILNQGYMKYELAYGNPSDIGFYLSDDPIITTDDYKLNYFDSNRSYYIPTLAANAQDKYNSWQRLPQTFPSGTYYFGAIADARSQMTEMDETNNASNAIAIEFVNDIDLTVTDLSTTTTKVERGGSFSATANISNIGTTDARFISARYYLSTDPTIDTGDISIGASYYNTELVAGSTQVSSLSTVLQANITSGTYYFGMIVDSLDVALETDETNNVMSIGTIEITGVDLVISSLTSSVASTASGDSITVSSTLQNAGGKLVASGQTVDIYLSSDADVTPTDIYLGSWTSAQSLVDGSIESSDLIVTIPQTFATGSYYLGAIVDKNNGTPESDENNNVTIGSQRIQVEGLAINGVDLVVSSIEVTGNLRLGGWGSVNFNTTNQGSVNASGLVVGAVYLSTDPVITTSDQIIFAPDYRSNIFGLNVGNTIPKTYYFNLRYITVPGQYYIGVIVDFWSAVTETDETNNTNSVAIQINP